MNLRSWRRLGAVAALVLVLVVASCGGEERATAETLAAEVCALMDQFLSGIDPDAIEEMDQSELAQLAEELEGRQTAFDEELAELRRRQSEAGVTEEDLTAAVGRECPEMSGLQTDG